MESEDMAIGVETKQEDTTQNNYRTRFREIVKYVLGFVPVVQNINIIDDNDIDGLISFEIPVESFGLNSQMIKKYQGEIFTKRFVDFIAEIVIRENLNQFIDEMKKMDVGSYIDAVSGRKHETFGMKMNSGNFIFSFHISLLQDLALSDFKNEGR